MLSSNGSYINVRRECVIAGERLLYDVCSARDLDVAQAYYGASFTYIGTGCTTIINNVPQQDFSEDHHFFIAAPPPTLI